MSFTRARGKRPHSCPHCRRAHYATQEGLYQHTRRVHRGIKYQDEIIVKNVYAVDMLARTVQCGKLHPSGERCRATFRPETAEIYLPEHERRFH